MPEQNSPEQGPSDQTRPTLEEKLAQAQSDTDRWSKIAASSSVSPQTALAARQAARSSAAAVELCRKALRWREDPEKAEEEHQLSLLSLNLSLLPSIPETPTGGPNKQPALSKAQSEGDGESGGVTISVAKRRRAERQARRLWRQSAAAPPSAANAPLALPTSDQSGSVQRPVPKTPREDRTLLESVVSPVWLWRLDEILPRPLALIVGLAWLFFVLGVIAVALGGVLDAFGLLPLDLPDD